MGHCHLLQSTHQSTQTVSRGAQKSGTGQWDTVTCYKAHISHQEEHRDLEWVSGTLSPATKHTSVNTDGVKRSTEIWNGSVGHCHLLQSTRQSRGAQKSGMGQWDTVTCYKAHISQHRRCQEEHRNLEWVSGTLSPATKHTSVNTDGVKRRTEIWNGSVGHCHLLQSTHQSTQMVSRGAQKSGMGQWDTVTCYKIQRFSNFNITGVTVGVSASEQQCNFKSV